MKNSVGQYYNLLIKTVLSNMKYVGLIVIVSSIFFGIFISIPVFSIDYNTYGFQLSTFSPSEFALMIFLSVLIGLITSIQVYTYKHKKSCSVRSELTKASVTGVSGAFSAVLGTAFCSSCLVPLFAAVGLGTGSVFFVLEYRIYFTVGSVIIMAVLLYFALKKLADITNNNKDKSKQYEA